MAWDLLDENCTDISDWVDADAGDAVSSQVTFDGKSTLKMDSGPNSAANDDRAWRYRDFGTYPDKFIVDVKIYHSALGTLAGQDHFNMRCYATDSGKELHVRWCTDGIFIKDNAGDSIEVGTNLVSIGTWQTWRFLVDMPNSTVSVYLDGALQQADMEIRPTVGGTEGQVFLLQYGFATNNRITYITHIRVGTFVGSPWYTYAQQGGA